MWMAEMPKHSDGAKRWEQLRFVLGMAQMAGAVVALTILLMNGVTTAGLVAVVGTSILTLVSVLLFGSRGDREDSKRRRV
jgi:hypothetical protein